MELLIGLAAFAAGAVVGGIVTLLVVARIDAEDARPYRHDPR